MFEIFSKKIDLKPEDIRKEGSLSKLSRHRKVWREYSFLIIRRWCVVTVDFLYTFKEEKQYKNPTEQLEIKKFKTIKSDETDNSSFVF
jgi:hypothetical protein